MTRISRISFIAITLATAGFAVLCQGATAGTTTAGCANLSSAQTTKCCARLEDQDATGCREPFVRLILKRQLLAKEGGGGTGGKGGRGGRK